MFAVLGMHQASLLKQMGQEGPRGEGCNLLSIVKATICNIYGVEI